MTRDAAADATRGPGMLPTIVLESSGQFRMLAADSGLHVLVGEYGYRVVFFLPLPEPLLLPDEYIIPFYDVLSTNELIALPDGAAALRCHRTLDVSLCFRRVEHDATPLPDFDVVWTATKAGLPGLDLPPDSTLQLDQTYPKALTSVVEVMTLVPEFDEEALTAAVDRGLNAIRRVQNAYGAATRRAVRALTRERCPFATIIHAYAPAASPLGPPDDQVLFLFNGHLPVTAEDEPLEPEELEAMAFYDSLGDQHLAIPARLGLDARREIEKEGNAWAGLTLLASACECYLDLLLTCLMWEDGLRPEDASYLFNGTVLGRVKEGLYTGRLDGDWSIDGDGAVAAWRQEIAMRRNTMLHRGAAPTPEEAKAALDAYNGLVQHIIDRLTANAEKYPRTMWMLLGAEQVPADARRHVEPLLESPSEPDWKQASRNWSEVMHHGTKFGAWRTSAVPAVAVRTALVILPNGERHWLTIDEASHRAKLLDGTPDAISPEALAAAARVPPRIGPQSIVFIQPETDQEGPWLPAYRLLPGDPVMVFGECLDYDV